jgi:hypothetical protein
MEHLVLHTAAFMFGSHHQRFDTPYGRLHTQVFNHFELMLIQRLHNKLNG